MRHTVPMISTPCKHAIDAQGNLHTLDRIYIEKLGMTVNGSIKAVSIINSLTKADVVGILEKIHVTTIGDVQKAVENLEGIEDIDVIRLTVGIEETLKAISDITNLDIGEITEIITKKNGAPVEDIVNRLHTKSKAACSNHA